LRLGTGGVKGDEPLKNKKNARKTSGVFLVLTIAIFLVPNPILPEETVREKLGASILGKFEEGKIDLDIEGTEGELSQGIFRSIRLEAEEFSTFVKAKEFFVQDIGLPEEILNASLPGLIVDKAVALFGQGKFNITSLIEKGEFRTLSLERADFYVAVSEKNLTRFIRKQNPRFRNLKIRLLENRARVQFDYIMLPVVMTGRFVLEHSKVYVREFKLYLAGIPMIILQEIMSAKVNPLADLTEFPFLVQLDTIEVSPGYLEIYTKGMKEVH